MKIGQLATSTGVPIETIRYYEAEGLLPAPMRTESNYRDYDTAHVERLAFIRHCRSMDMALDEIRTLLQFKDSPSAECGEVNALLDSHMGHVAERVRELKELAKQLKALRAQCRESATARECGILKELSSPSASVARPRQHVHGTHR
jgi:Cd(II)/Pb(II)-responsive transcriptional regulator